MQNLLNAIQILLVNPSHPGNIGAVARAMKNMGLEQLHLVKPRRAINQEAYARASGANSILDNAQHHDHLTHALADQQLIFGRSARSCIPGIPFLTPRKAADLALNAAKQKQSVMMVFGREHAGLSNEELAHCHYHIQIPCNPHFSSLNLGAAVQILCYELHLAANDPPKALGEFKEDLGTHEEIEYFLTHLEKTLAAISFYDPKNPRRLLPKLRALFNRTHLLKSEVAILRGILTAVDKVKSVK